MRQPRCGRSADPTPRPVRYLAKPVSVRPGLHSICRILRHLRLAEQWRSESGEALESHGAYLAWSGDAMTALAPEVIVSSEKYAGGDRFAELWTASEHRLPNPAHTRIIPTDPSLQRAFLAPSHVVLQKTLRSTVVAYAVKASVAPLFCCDREQSLS